MTDVQNGTQYNGETSPPWSSTTIIVVSVFIFLLIVAAALTFRMVIAMLIVAAIIAYLFRPVVGKMRSRLKLPKGYASALIYALLLAVIVPALILLIPILVGQLTAVQIQLLSFARALISLGPEETITIIGFEVGLQNLVNEFNLALMAFTRSLTSRSLELIQSIAQTVLMTIFTILISFYLTRDAEEFIQWFHDLVPRNYQQDAQKLIEEVDKVWSAFLRGQVSLSFIVTVILTAVSAALGLPHPVLFGIWGGLLEFLPSIGNIIWGISAIIVALLEGSTHIPVTNVNFALIVLAAYIVFSQLDINILIPNIIGKHVSLHPMVVILGVIIGITVGGVLGVALAAPTIATLRVFGRYIYAKLFHLSPFQPVRSQTGLPEESNK